MDFPVAFAWAVRPELFVGCCALVCGLGLLLTLVGLRAAGGQPVIAERAWRDLLHRVGLIDTSRSSAVAIGVSQLLTGLFLVLASLSVVLWNGPMANPTVLLAWLYDDSGAPIEIEGDSLQQSERSMAPMPLGELGQPRVPLARFFIDQSKLNLTAPLGTSKGRHFSELAPSGGMLVGFRVTTAHPAAPAHAKLNSIQAIYHVGNRYELGEVMGEPGPIERESLAPAGFAIGELWANVNRQIEALKPIFFTYSAGVLHGNGQEGSWLGDDTEATQRITFRQPAVGYVASIRHHTVMSLEVLYHDENLAALHVCKEKLPAVEATEVVDVVLDASPELPSVIDGTRIFRKPHVFNAPEGGLLVGLKMAFTDDYWGQIEGMQPIFQRGTEYTISEPTEKVFAKTFLAKPGYAVGGVSTFGRDAVRVVFMRVLDGGRLDATDAYEEVVGGNSSDGNQQMTSSWLSDGRPAVGLRFQETRLGDRKSYAELALRVANLPQDPP